MPELIDNNEDDKEDHNDYDMNPLGELPSPVPDIHPSDHSTPPPQSFGDGPPKLPPGISHIFYPTINSTL